MDKTQPHPMFKLATELGPLIVFFAANAKFNLFVATGAFMVAIVAAMIASYVVTKHVPMMALVTGVIVLVFGTLTLVLHDETFIKVKPTIIYGLFAAILGGGLLFGRSFIAIMFDQMFNLTPHGWRILTMRWAHSRRRLWGLRSAAVSISTRSRRRMAALRSRTGRSSRPMWRSRWRRSLRV